MLNEIEFLSWCEKNNISNINRDYINNSIRFQQPVRSVGTGNRSLSGKYPSKKMGKTIQWESGKVEGPAILIMEHDEKVLEFYDQPNKINLRYTKDGRTRGTLYTPDFFVIRTNSAGWEEWKDEKELEEIAKKQPWKYVKDSEGSWRCPPGEDFAKQYNFYFRVCTNNQVNWNMHRNFVFLDDYLRKQNKLIVSEENLEKIKQCIFREVGINLRKLISLAKSKGFSVDDIYISILKDFIYVDLTNSVLAEPETVSLFLHKEHSDMYTNLIHCEKEYTTGFSKNVVDVGKEILWDGQIWKIINVGNTSISLSSNGKYNEVSKELFHRLVSDGKIVIEGVIPSGEDDALMDIVNGSSDEDYKIANYRYNFVKAYLKDGKKNLESLEEPKLRTIRDWVKNFKKAESLFGNGYVGLLPNNKNKGNRATRLNQQVKELMDQFIRENYETIVQKNKASVYGSFRNECEERGYSTPSYMTFCKNVNNRPREEQVTKRKGKRAGYQVKDFYWEIERTTPRHGDFPFNICHLDHTELDIELICSETGKNLGRPYLSLLIDAFSRRVLASYLSFEPPSYRSCLMVFRECVKRYNRLPQKLVVDNGKEFHSTYFETLLAMYECESKRRPAAQPRYGSVLERLFGTTNTSFIHNLTGNTKIMKNVREVTKTVNPKSHARWNLKNLTIALESFFFELYDTIEHPALGKTPRNAYDDGLFLMGERQHHFIPFDRIFEILTLPTTRSGESKIQPSMGIKVNYIYYWNDDFKNPQLENTKVKVRYDPFNVGIAYAYINKMWVKCISEHYPLFKNLTEKELKFITAEFKKTKQLHAQNFSITAQRIAKFIDDLEGNEQFLLLKAKSEEIKNVINLGDNIPLEKTDLSKNKLNSSNSEGIVKQNKVRIEKSLDIYGEF
ncbi:TnsA endonuclease N-terminal domain-containing protein [Peribacillus sp. NPDC096540]|uniref:TnsA endonuclease N-terminal domain-containing protein n=1 Tax=Peribacillus sp. NPDC096540 TaxID=3390612 RepID=UPI003D07CF41